MIDRISCIDAWYRAGGVLFSQDPYLSSPEQHMESLSSIFWGTMDISSGEDAGGICLNQLTEYLGDETERHLAFLKKVNLIVIGDSCFGPIVSLSEQGNNLMNKLMETMDSLAPSIPNHHLH